MEFRQVDIDKIMDHLVHQHKYFMFNDKLFADYVGRFEYIGLACSRVKDVCGHWDGGLPVINASKHDAYWEYYNKRTANVVGDYYRNDIEVLNYDFPIKGWVDTSEEWLKVKRLKVS